MASIKEEDISTVEMDYVLSEVIDHDPLFDDSGANDLRNDDDPVVKELDVFLTPQQPGSVCLLQYPLCTQTIPDFASIRYKAKHGLLQMDDADGRKWNSQTVSLQTHLCLATVKNDNLLLTPLDRIWQMRPSLEHLDEPSSVTPAAANTTDWQPVQYSRAESERAAQIRKSSWNYQQSSTEAEEWTEVTLEEGKLVPTVPARATGTASKYLDSLCASAQASKPLAARTVASICARIVTLLQSGRPTPYSLISQAIGSDELTKEALRVCTVQLHGHVHLLKSRYQGLPKRPRTLILYLLQTRGSVVRASLRATYPKLSNETLEALLVQVASLQGRVWVLNVSIDQNSNVDAQYYQDYWIQTIATRYQADIAAYDSASM